MKTVTVSHSLRANLHMDKRVTVTVLNGIFISKEYSILEKQKKNLIPKSIVS